MQVSLQTGPALRLRVSRILAGLFVEPVAIVPARPVGLPITLTDPAELVYRAPKKASARATLKPYLPETRSGLQRHFLQVMWLKIMNWSVLICAEKLLGVDSLASPILLDSGVALGAFLGIGHQPITRLGIVRAFLFP